MTYNERIIKRIQRSVVDIIRKSDHITNTKIKAAQIKTDIMKYMRNLQGGGVIYDFLVSVMELSRDMISISVVSKVEIATEFVMCQFTTKTKSYTSGFDRAMKGV